MYRFRMDQVAREDIAAAAAARRELGSGYDDVIAEGLIERIGAEIDKRVDAKLEGRRRTIRRTDIRELERRRTLWKGAAIGSAVMAVPAVIAIMNNPFNHKPVVFVIALWGVIAAGYAVAAWVHLRRQLDDRGD